MTPQPEWAGRLVVGAAHPLPLPQPDAPAFACAPGAWAVLDGLPDAAAVVSVETTRILAANVAMRRLLGRAAGELVGRPISEFAATPQDLALWDELGQASSALDPAAFEPRTHDTWLVAGEAEPRPLTLHVARLDTLPACWLVTLRDRSDEVRLRQTLDERLADLQATMESTADGLLVTDLVGRIQHFNRRFARLWQLPEALLHRGETDALFDWLATRVTDVPAWRRLRAGWTEAAATETTDVIALRDGQVLEVASRPRLAHGRAVGRVTAFRDLTERQRSLAEIERLTHTDALTGLSNRRAFVQAVDGGIGGVRRDARPAALLLLDLDRFRTVDESLGSAAADQVLVEAARRLRRVVEAGDVLARLAGDEFAIALPDADAGVAESLARRAMAALAPAFQVGETRFSLTASIGIALAPNDGSDAESLLHSAASAMRRAKDAGRATVRFHQPRRNVDLRERLELDHAMRQGLAAGCFRIEVQPQFDLATGALAGVEALARWRDPRLGEIGPHRFVPVAEDSGFIVELGQWVLDEAVRHAARWWRDGLQVPIAVNVSALQFRHPDFVDRVALSLETAGLPARALELELTESILVDEGGEALARLQQLDDLGVTLALDDFGTGYSNLAVLKRFPISRLKIDRSFVSALPDGDSDGAIVHAIAAMARALRMKVVAEGVETEAQRAFLQRVGCHLMQGFLRSRPIPVAQFEARCRAGDWVPAGAGHTGADVSPEGPGEGALPRPPARARAGRAALAALTQRISPRRPGHRLGKR